MTQVNENAQTRKILNFRTIIEIAFLIFVIAIPIVTAYYYDSQSIVVSQVIRNI
jgi:hypothetical protein